MIDLPQGEDAAYLNALELSAIYISVGMGGCSVRASRDLGKSAAMQPPGFEIIAAWWTDRESDAKRVEVMVGRRPPDAVIATEAIVAAGQATGIRLVEHATVLKRARAASERVKRAMNIGNTGGELAWFNRAYRAYRLRQAGRPLSYAVARRRLCTAMARRLVMLQGVEFGDDILVEVFGRGYAPHFAGEAQKSD